MDFEQRWQDRGNEKQDMQVFLTDFFETIGNVKKVSYFACFEKPVMLKHKSYIDCYIPATRVLIEQKDITCDLNKKYKQSSGEDLTTFE